MSVSLETLDAAIGAVDMGPAGFNITGRVAGPAAPGSNGVEVKIEQPKMDAAIKDHDNSKPNLQFSKSMQKGMERIADGQNQHAQLLDKTGLTKKVDQVLSRGAGFRNLRQENTSTSIHTPAVPQLKHPRHKQEVRKTLEIAKRAYLRRNRELTNLPKTKTVAIPQAIREESLADAGRQQGFKPQQAPRGLRSEYAKWGATLFPGSYIEGPKLKRT